MWKYCICEYSPPFFNCFFLVFHSSAVQWLNCWNLKYELNFSYISKGDAYLLQSVAIHFNHTVDACPGNLHTFEAVLKISQTLFWSISSEYLTVSILGSYLFFWGGFIISYELYFCIFGWNFAWSVSKLCLNWKRDIAKFFPDTTVFFYEKNSRY